MIIRNAFDVDVMAVLDNLSDISRDELKHFGKTPEDGAEYALRMIKENGGKAGVVNGEVVVVFGLDYSDQDAVFTWVLTTDAYFKQPPSGYKAYRKFMKELVAAHEKPVMSISGSKHPEVERWFALTGGKMVLKNNKVRVFHFG